MRRSAAAASLLLMTLLQPGAPRAGGGAPPRQSVWHRTALLGDPGGVRGRLEELGVGLQLFYHQFGGWKPRGGGRDSGSTLGASGSYDFFARADLEELVTWRGADLLLHVKGQYDSNLNEEVGALSDPIDDSDFDEGIYVDELWLQQALWGDRLRLRAGFLEQQTVFDRNAYANSEDRQFLNAFFDNNPVVPLPNGLGATLIAVPIPAIEIAVGVGDADNESRHAGFHTAFDGVDSLTSYLEVTVHSRFESRRGALPGSWRMGLFRDGSERVEFGSAPPNRDRGHLGGYLSLNQLLFRFDAEGDRGLGVFGRFGGADPDVNRIAWFGSLGAQVQGPLAARGRDCIGIAVYHAVGSHRYRRRVAPGFDAETGVEFYYRAEIFPWLAVTPDLQYIIDPGADGDADDAVIAILRLRMSF